MKLAQSSVVAGGLIAAADGVVLDAQALLPCACCVMCHIVAFEVWQCWSCPYHCFESTIQSKGAAKPAGDIALIRGGKLLIIEADEPYQFSTGDQFGIVSDSYVKWRGGKIPSEEQEPKVS